MAASNQGTGRVWTSGRGFASMDPERQREVVGYVGSGPIETEAPRTERADRTMRTDWMRVQPDRDTTNYEGSSSRRGR